MYYDIIGLGEIIADITVNSKDQQIARFPGGAPLNVIATMAKYNCKTSYIGKVGNDEDGKYILDYLKTLNVDSSNIIIDDTRETTKAFVSIDEKGERSFKFHRDNTADINLTKLEINEKAIKNSKLFHFGALSLTTKTYENATRHALDIARESKCIISFDPNYRESLWKNKKTAIRKIKKVLPHIHILKICTEEAQLLTNTSDNISALKTLSKYNIPIILLTDGPRGAMFKVKNFIGNAKAPNVTPVDTTGAGDIFLGTFLSMIVKYENRIESIYYNTILNYVNKACRQASLSTLEKGAITSIPNL